MITSIQTCQAFMRDLANHLQIRFPSTASGLSYVRQAFDTNGFPELFISHGGNEAEGQPVVYIRIMQINAVSVDVFGNPLLAYAPLQAQVAYELGAAGNETFVSHADLITAEFELIKTAITLQVIEIANGTAVTEASVNAAASSPGPIASLDELYWPLKNP